MQINAFGSTKYSQRLVLWQAWGLVFLALILTACDRAPVYSGLYVTGFDYTHRQIGNIVVEDEFGNRFGTGSPGGEGSLSCCQVVKGSHVKVTWSYSHKSVQEYADGKPEETKEARVQMPPISDIPKGKGTMRILEIHIFPDEHVELVITEEMFGRNRFPNFEVGQKLMLDEDFKQWIALYKEHTRSFFPVLDFVLGSAYKKYRMTDQRDLEVYAMMAFKVSPTFDQHPLVVPLIDQAKDQPGKFADLIGQLSDAQLREIRSANPAQPPNPKEDLK